MKILFILHLFSQTRHFHTVFQELIARGHTLDVVGLNKLTNQGPTIRPPSHAKHISPIAYHRLPDNRTDFWGGYVEALRGSRNLLLYCHPSFKKATVFRERAVGYTDAFLTRFMPVDGGMPPDWLLRFYRMAEAAIPPDPAVVSLLQEKQPDVVLVSPLINHEMPMLHEHVKAAHMLGIPVGFPVFSWDNLTTKGTIHDMPDRLFVWNDIQKREAIEFHGVPAEKVEVFGGWRFDEFLGFKPRVSRAEFYAAHGFDEAEKIVYYLGSSPIIAPTEVEFVVEWLKAIRNSPDERLRNANILIRPHPRNLKAWQNAAGLGSQPRVSLELIEHLSLFETQSLYDDLYHADIIVGLVTSGMIEAALLRKPIHTVMTKLAGEGQSGTIHFEYLATAGGGLLYIAEDFAEHVALLAQHLVRPPGTPDERAGNFLRAFIDPPDPAVSSTKALADAIERLGAVKKAPRKASMGEILMRAVLKAALTTRLLPIKRFAEKAADQEDR